MSEITEEALQLLLDTGRSLALEAKAHPHQRGRPYIILRSWVGQELSESLQFLDDASGLRETPPYKSGSVALQDADSFCRYFADQMTDESRVYASLNPLRFTAVLNEHPAGKSAADWRDHRAIYQPAYSPELQAWMAQDKKQFKGNIEFAEWLQDQGPDFVEPTGAEILEIALNFSVHDTVAYSNPTRLTNGNTELSWKRIVEGSSSTGAGKVRIPELLSIEIPVWAGLAQEKYRLGAHLRYRLRDAGLIIWYQLIRPHKVIEQAYADLVGIINAATDNPVLFGTPE